VAAPPPTDPLAPSPGPPTPDLAADASAPYDPQAYRSALLHPEDYRAVLLRPFYALLNEHPQFPIDMNLLMTQCRLFHRRDETHR
jgi:hypothetical protein